MLANSFRTFNLLKKAYPISSRFYSKKTEKRNLIYATLNDKDLTYFERLLTKTRCITDPQLLDSYNTDWLRIVKGNSSCKIINFNF